jgi:hypothetical protein
VIARPAQRSHVPGLPLPAVAEHSEQDRAGPGKARSDHPLCPLGADTDVVLRGVLGLGAAEIADLRATGALGRRAVSPVLSSWRRHVPSPGRLPRTRGDWPEPRSTAILGRHAGGGHERSGHSVRRWRGL